MWLRHWVPRTCAAAAARPPGRTSRSKPPRTSRTSRPRRPPPRIHGGQAGGASSARMAAPARSAPSQSLSPAASSGGGTRDVELRRLRRVRRRRAHLLRLPARLDGDYRRRRLPTSEHGREVVGGSSGGFGAAPRSSLAEDGKCARNSGWSSERGDSGGLPRRRCSRIFCKSIL